ncbi:hypothetical protein BOX15_Mlig018348g2 [Macrostomum lignano]|uniref:PHD-type domain-containing protein n=1 Tax=Macrostomum lignano TaxID=282301 RepID=A0A267GS09_9PLAT|nr:hypothetical protein BOX15_Mlig018348g2 [Macrostomum lignano]
MNNNARGSPTGASGERQLALWQARLRRWREFDTESQSSVAECFDAAYVSRMKVADIEQLPTKRPLKVSDPWRHEWQRGVQVPVLARQEQPKPSVRYLEADDCLVECDSVDVELTPTPKWRLPKKLLTSLDDYTFDPDTQETSTGPVAIRPGEPEPRCRLYCSDELDRRWIDATSGLASVSLDSLEAVFTAAESLAHERMLDRLRTVAGLGIEYDTTVPCSVCQSLEVEEDNEILFCDGCDTPVHQACYGVASVPSGSWLCRPCSLGVRPICALCSSSGGAMKSTRDGATWCHVSCALWIPEVGFADPERMEPITRLNEIPTGRWNLVCRLCREKVGACIQCCVKQCKVAFHVTCAFRHKLVMRQVLSGGDVRNLAYCERHGDKFRQTGVTPHSSPTKARPKYKGVSGGGGGGAGGAAGAGRGRGRGRKRGRPPSAARAKLAAEVADEDAEAEADPDASQDSLLDAKRPRLDEDVMFEDAIDSSTAVKSETPDGDGAAELKPELPSEDGGFESELQPRPDSEAKEAQVEDDPLAAAVRAAATAADPGDDPDGQENQRNQLLKELEANFYTLFSKEELIAKMAPVKVDALALSLLLDYWKLKRTANGCRPLMEQPDDQSLRPVNTEERRLQERAQMFVCLRHDMERVRNLCYLIVRREKLKRSLLSTGERISAFQLKPTRKNKSLRRLQPEDWRLLTDAHIGPSFYENQQLLRSLLQPAEQQRDSQRPSKPAAADQFEDAPQLDESPAAQPLAPGCLDPSEICLTDGDYRRLGRELRDGGLLATAAGDGEAAAATLIDLGSSAPAPTQQRRQVARRRRRRRTDADGIATADSTNSLAAEQAVAEATRALRQLPARALRVAETIRRQLRAGLRDPMFNSLVADCPSSSDEDDDVADEVSKHRVDMNGSESQDGSVSASSCARKSALLEENIYNHKQVGADPEVELDAEADADLEVEPDADPQVEPDVDANNCAATEAFDDANTPMEADPDADPDDDDGNGEPTPTPPPMADTDVDADENGEEEEAASPCRKDPPLASERQSSGNIFEKLSKA